ncbi:MAG: FHA domain-containing protein [Anaerolineae bacterium]|nr:FHA domain-containing protein [Anaerolineae bacterium]
MPERQLLPADLFPQYTRLRRQGMNIDEALESLAKKAGGLTLSRQQELASMIGAWEVEEAARQDRRVEPQTLPPDHVTCSNCGRGNHPNEFYCYACGHILPHAPDTRRLQGRYDAMPPHIRWGTARFAEHQRLALIPQHGAPIEIGLSDGGDIIIGRISRDPIAVPNVDLTPYDAEALGVSRLHVAIARQESTVTITDLGSLNHTYINGQRLFPQEVRALRDGDELRLGRMVLRVRFISAGGEEAAATAG